MKDLLNKYRSGRITPEEMEILSEKIEETSDATISDIIEGEWEKFSDRNAADIRGKHPDRWRRYCLTGAACIAFLVCLAFAARNMIVLHGINAVASKELTVKTGNTGMTSIKLPDGTNVTLNSRSSLMYPAGFGFESRRVKISGEGFFDVSHDPDQKFIVEAPGMNIIVHGTVFNIYAYPEGEYTEMSLVKGEVTVQCNGAEARISSGEKVCVKRGTDDIVIMKTDNDVETAWLRDKLVFVHEPLYQVFEILQRRFGVEIHCQEDKYLTDCYTGTFRGRDINEILDILEIHYGFSHRFVNEHTIFIN